MSNTYLDLESFYSAPVNFTSSYYESLEYIKNQFSYDALSFKRLTNPSSNKNKNYGDFLCKSINLENNLKSLYYVESNINEVLDFIIKKNLLDIIFSIPNKIFEYFNEFILDLKFEVKYDDVKLLNVIIFTNYDGSLACDLVNKVNEYFIENHEDDFIDNFLISAEPV